MLDQHGQEAEDNLQFGGLAVVQSTKNMNSSSFDYEPSVGMSIRRVKEDLLLALIIILVILLSSFRPISNKQLSKSARPLESMS